VTATTHKSNSRVGEDYDRPRHADWIVHPMQCCTEDIREPEEPPGQNGKWTQTDLETIGSYDGGDARPENTGVPLNPPSVRFNIDINDASCLTTHEQRNWVPNTFSKTRRTSGDLADKRTIVDGAGTPQNSNVRRPRNRRWNTRTNGTVPSTALGGRRRRSRYLKAGGHSCRDPLPYRFLRRLSLRLLSSAGDTRGGF
jgi:hypothetical protein